MGADTRALKALFEGTRYFLAHLAPDSTLPDRLNPFRRIEGELQLEFAWFDKSQLRELDVRPSFLRRALGCAQFAFEHVIAQEN